MVLDGHSGDKAADYCKKNVGRMLSKQTSLERDSCNAVREGNINLCNASPLVFKQLDLDFLSLAKDQNLSDGTTCLLALITDCKLTIANLGDSSAILIRNNQMLELTSE